jgi:MoaA/NifB/PqqE/SkfB family radical SAM enzyme
MLGYYEVTNGCNCTCPHCFVNDLDRKNPAHKSFPDITADFSRLHELGVDRIVLSGGEPTLRFTLPEIVQYAKTIFKQVNVLSNCSKPETLQKITDTAIVWASIDYVGYKQDEWRGYKGVWENFLKLSKNVNIRSTLMKDNLVDIKQLVKLAYKNNKQITIAPYRGSKNFTPTAQDLLSLTTMIVNEGYQTAVIDDPSIRALISSYTDLNKFVGCEACQATLRVKLNGKVTPCPFLHQEICDLYDPQIKTKLSYARSQLLSSYTENCACCDKKQLCGGCKASTNTYCLLPLFT